MREINAEGFIYNAKTYEKEFQHLLCGIVSCYMMMIADKVLLTNNEGDIRDKLLIDYLNNDDIRNKTELNEFSFNKEVPENETGGRTDIKIEIKNPFRKVKAYYVIECKRLDGKNTTGVSGLNAEYIKNGIHRFVSKLYTTNCKINAMIGFVVEKLDIHFIVSEINKLSKAHFKEMIKMKQEICKEKFIPNFDYHYSSIHNDCDNSEFTLYHLMLDISKLLKSKVK